jgi:RNA polymerase sigma-70 factor (ECF subfamily)
VPGDPKVPELLERYLPQLRAFVRLRVDGALRARESSSDLVQSICRELLEGARGFAFDGEERFRAWLFTAALNKLRDRGRSHGADRRSAARERHDADECYFGAYSGLPSPSQFAGASELAGLMEAAFERLTEAEREVITLAKIAGLSRAEVARVMGRTEGAVRVLLSRSLQRYIAAMNEIRQARG